MKSSLNQPNERHITLELTFFTKKSQEITQRKALINTILTAREISLLGDASGN